jgi:hypothetical protein
VDEKYISTMRNAAYRLNQYVFKMFLRRVYVKNLTTYAIFSVLATILSKIPITTFQPLTQGLFLLARAEATMLEWCFVNFHLSYIRNQLWITGQWRKKNKTTGQIMPMMCGFAVVREPLKNFTPLAAVPFSCDEDDYSPEMFCDDEDSDLSEDSVTVCNGAYSTLPIMPQGHRLPAL